MSGAATRRGRPPRRGRGRGGGGQDEPAASTTGKRRRRDNPQDEGDEEYAMPAKMTRRILNQAREQQQEIEDEDGDRPSDFQVVDFDDGAILQGMELGGSDDEGSQVSEAEGRYFDGEDEEEFTFEDEQALQAFMAGGLSQRRTLADLIMEKIAEHDEQAPHANQGKVKVDPKIVECYTGVGRMLSAYRSGKLPKAFKIIPALSNWEEVLYYTEPDKWSPNALRQATRLFASNLNPNMAQRFYNLVLLPRVRDEIHEKKKLHWSIYQALRKACYKPAAFYKGIVLPLCESGDCTLREATIVGSVIRQVSLPVVHSSVALLKLAEMRYTGANSIFMRILIEKKYALPYRVIDGVVKHFCSFVDDIRVLPVLWHRCLLSFAQRYKTDLNAGQLESLKLLLRAQCHDLITPEIRRQLFQQRSDKVAGATSANARSVVAAVPDQDDLVME